MECKRKDRSKFVKLSSAVDPSFWHKLSEIKIDIDKLDDTERQIWGYCFNMQTQSSSLTNLLILDSTSFNRSPDNQQTAIVFHGKIFNKNTYEEFRRCCENNMQFINEIGESVWNNIRKATALENPSILNNFFVLTFADLKKFVYYYWYAFPTPANVISESNLLSSNFVADVFEEQQIQILHDKWQKLPNEQKSFFIFDKNSSNIELYMLKEKLKEFTSADNYDNIYFAFYDISSTDMPGIILKSYLLLILYYCDFLKGETINILSFRLSRSQSAICCARSIVFRIELNCNLDLSREKLATKWKGWEQSNGKSQPKVANMKNSMDPSVLAENAVDLNLKLMKWRLLPDINLETIKSSKCLLIGAGTLGCSTARILLGWGVRHISFIDNSRVSFSNPIRQCLFTYQDSVDSKPKVMAAVDSLKNIFPRITAEGYNLHIPMPDHPVGELLLDETKDNVNTLSDLIKNHDLIFILTDSRESRWLPTLLGAFHNKIVLNAALGFDSYLIMRHGTCVENSGNIPEAPKGFKMIPGNQLGCYFCTDVLAPSNSLKDRSLDQQCTVVRPGVSAIAGALIVELAISVLQHPSGANAPAFYKTFDDPNDIFREDECLLGIIPHSIRGFLSSFSHMLPASPKFPQCTACSDIVLQEYSKDGFEFLKKVFDSFKYLAELTKLEELYNNDDDILSFSDEDSISSQ